MRKKKAETPLRELRVARTLNQAQLARLVRVSQQTLSKYESGAIVPPVHVQARIAAILGTDVDTLFPAA